MTKQEESKLRVQGMDWFDRNIKFHYDDWVSPLCSRCQDKEYIVVEAYGYGHVWHLCSTCATELEIPYE